MNNFLDIWFDIAAVVIFTLAAIFIGFILFVLITEYLKGGFIFHP